MKQIIRVNKPVAPRVRDSHIIPRFYLDKFADETRQVHVYQKGLPVRKKSTKSQCTQRDYFEYDFGNEQSNNKHELLFGRIETMAGKIYPKLLRAEEAFDQDEVVAWALFVASLFLRSRKVRNQIAPAILDAMKASVLDPARVEAIQYELFQRGQLYSKEEISDVVHKAWSDINANPAFLQLSKIEERTASLAHSIGRKAWHTLHPAPGKTFVTSDCPVISLKLTGTGVAFAGFGFGQDDVAAVLPLTPDALFVASPPSIAWTKRFDETGTAAMNKAIVQYAEKRVFSSIRSERISKLVDAEMNQVVFGENAFVVPKNNLEKLVSLD